jgi:perosamine synthetase
MIARFKISLDLSDLIETLKITKNATKKFEEYFAMSFEFKHVFSYSYGRSALRFLMESTGIKNSEVVLSAYTCSVVAHAVVLSGNKPVFADIELQEYNPSSEVIYKAITSNTRFVILSHTFGYPQNSKEIQREIKKYEKIYNHRIWLINDCAHSFDAKNEGNRVMEYGDAAIFGLNISKSITTVFGGIAATNNDLLASMIKQYNETLKSKSGIKREIYQRLYIILAYIAFKRVPYGITQFLIRKTSLLSKLTDSYHLDDRIHFPKDYAKPLTAIAGQVGLRQIAKYSNFTNKRIANSKIYDFGIRDSRLIKKPQQITGATYSHYPVQVFNKSIVMNEMLKRGVECGEVIQYSIPNLESYFKYAKSDTPNSTLASTTVINLPINYSERITHYVCDQLNEVIANLEITANEQPK